VARLYAVARETVFNARKRLCIPSARSLGARPQRKTGVLSVSEAKARIARLGSGEGFAYYRGYLMRDRRRRSQVGRALSELADFMSRQCGYLTQRKHGDFDYEYLFIKGRSAPPPSPPSTL
jgi:hypothetical protein